MAESSARVFFFFLLYLFGPTRTYQYEGLDQRCRVQAILRDSSSQDLRYIIISVSDKSAFSECIEIANFSLTHCGKNFTSKSHHNNRAIATIFRDSDRRYVTCCKKQTEKGENRTTYSGMSAHVL